VVESNLTDGIVQQVKTRPGAVAVHLPGGGLTFAQLDNLVWQIATLLHHGGVKPGDVVALTFGSELIVLVTMLATARLGATVFSVPDNYPPLQKSELMMRAGVSVIASDHAEGHDPSLPVLLIDRTSIGNRSLPVDTGVRQEYPEAPWLIIAGSGSTGTPKLIPLSHQVFLQRIELFDKAIPLTQDDCIASFINIDFQVAKIQYLHALFTGASIAFRSLMGGDVFEFCRRNQVTVLYTAVIHLKQLVSKAARQPGQALGFLRALVAGGSTVSDRLRKDIASHLSDKLYVRYGTNETGPISDASPPEVFSVPGSIGRPYGGIELQVIGKGGLPLAVGDIGLVRIRTPGVISHYLGDEEATRKALQGSWFLPGDLGKLTGEGQLVYCGRADHMMIMDGVNIYPAEIERVICEHSAVRDAAAMPVRSDLHQEIPVCAVELMDDCHVTEQELGSYCVARLGFRAPKRIVQVDKIPRTEQGKLIRAELASQIGSRLGIRHFKT